jgi:DHA2 family multidrug resistance protein
VQTLLALFALGLSALVLRELRIRNPLINFRTLADQNFRWSCVIIFCAFGVLYANTTTLPALLQSLFGYDATTSGLVLSPSGVVAVMMLFVVGLALSRRVDARWLMAAGLIIMGIGNYWMSQMNLDISSWEVVWPRCVVIGGLSMIFAPLNVAAFLYIPPQLRGAAVGLLALLRNEGGSVGTSTAQTIHERREIFHALRLNENLDRLNPAVKSFMAQAQPGFLQQTGDHAAAKEMTLQALENLREQQASALAYFDTFLVFAAVGVALSFLVLLMKPSVVAKGAHVAAE